MLFLLDTNIISNLVRDPEGPVFQKLAELGEHNSCTSIIVAAEMRFGAARPGQGHLQSRVEGILRRFQVVPWDAPADQAYAELRAQLEAAGTPIGANDMFIAAHALALGLTLVTDNEREFRRIPDLAVENWLRT